MKFGLALLLLSWPALLPASTNTQSQYSYAPVLNQDFVTPRILLDHETGISYFLDSDGRHVSAVNPAGKLLWRVDPLEDAKMPAYRTAIILLFDIPDEKWWENRKRQFGKRSAYIAISYSTLQFGLLRKSDGEFIFLGQD